MGAGGARGRARGRAHHDARYEARWDTPLGALALVEPAPAEVAPHAARLAAAYSDPRNAPLLGHTEPLDEADVLAHYRGLADEGARPRLFLRDGALAGDGDLRGLDGRGAAELAFLVADPAAQGRGLGTRFAVMVHALAFGPLGLARLFASVLPENAASRRVFAKLGYAEVAGAAARGYGDPGDLVLAIDAAAFAARWAAALTEIRVAPRAAAG